MEPEFKKTKTCEQTPPLLFFGLSIVSAAIAISYYWRYAVISNDDAFIYFTMVRNILAGFGPVVNPGDTHSPATSLVWVYLLALLQWIWPAVSITYIAKFTSTTLLFLTSVIWCYVFQKPAKELALAAPFSISSILLYRLCPGMDISLSLFIYSLIFFFYFRNRYEYAAALCGFSFFCRGESVIILAPLVAHYIYTAYRANRLKESMRQLMMSGLCFVSVACIGLLLQKICLDTPYPATLKVKMLQGQGGWITYQHYLPTYIKEGMGDHWSDAWYLLIGVFLLGWPGLLLLCAAGLQAVCFSVLTIAAYNWYSWILQASLRFYAFLGATKLIEWLVRFCGWLINFISPYKIPAPAARLLGVALGVWICFNHFFFFIEYQTRNNDGVVIDFVLFESYFDFSDILNSQRSQFSLHPYPVILTEEIGVLSHELKGYVVRDINGLASPGLTKDNLLDWKYWVNKYEPEYLAKMGQASMPVLCFESDSEKKPSLYTYELIAYDEDRPVGLYKRNHSFERLKEYDNLRRLVSAYAPGMQKPIIDARYPGRPVLYFIPPADFMFPAPSYATQCSMEVGLRAMAANVVPLCDGVTFRVIGTHRDGQRVVYAESKVMPVAQEVSPNGVSALIRFHYDPQVVEEFRIVVDPNPGGNAYDWPFIGNFGFQ